MVGIILLIVSLIECSMKISDSVTYKFINHSKIESNNLESCCHLKKYLIGLPLESKIDKNNSSCISVTGFFKKELELGENQICSDCLTWFKNHISKDKTMALRPNFIPISGFSGNSFVCIPSSENLDSIPVYTSPTDYYTVLIEEPNGLLLLYKLEKYEKDSSFLLSPLSEDLNSVDFKKLRLDWLDSNLVYFSYYSGSKINLSEYLINSVYN